MPNLNSGVYDFPLYDMGLNYSVNIEQITIGTVPETIKKFILAETSPLVN